MVRVQSLKWRRERRYVPRCGNSRDSKNRWSRQPGLSAGERKKDGQYWLWGLFPLVKRYANNNQKSERKGIPRYSKRMASNMPARSVRNNSTAYEAV